MLQLLCIFYVSCKYKAVQNHFLQQNLKTSHIFSKAIALDTIFSLPTEGLCSLSMQLFEIWTHSLERGVLPNPLTYFKKGWAAIKLLNGAWEPQWLLFSAQQFHILHLPHIDFALLSSKTPRFCDRKVTIKRISFFWPLFTKQQTMMTFTFVHITKIIRDEHKLLTNLSYAIWLSLCTVNILLNWKEFNSQQDPNYSFWKILMKNKVMQLYRWCSLNTHFQYGFKKGHIFRFKCLDAEKFTSNMVLWIKVFCKTKRIVMCISQC